MIFLEHGVINYSWSADYFAWMLANEDTLRNLRNRRYWADQMDSRGLRGSTGIRQP